MKKVFINLSILAILLNLFVACAKKGDVGPQGANGLNGAQGPQGDPGTQGPKGDQGAQGDPGAQGPKGENGNSDAKAYLFTESFEFRPGNTGKNFTVPGVNAQAMDSLLVLGYFYMTANNVNYWYPAPGVGPFSAFNMRFYYDEGLNQMSYAIRNVDGGIYNGPPYTVSKFKIVVIPATKINGRMAVDFSNYAQTMKLFGLSE